MKDLLSTYKKPFALIHDKGEFEGGLCISHDQFDDLHSMRHDFLHPVEKTYYSTLTHQKRQYSYLLGRYCAKQAVAAYKNFPVLFPEIHIQHGLFQQPILSHPTLSNIQVSISHTEMVGAAIAFSEIHPMAIDIEILSPSKVETIKTQMTDAEKRFPPVFSGSETELMTVLWTAKEALSKVLKCGLTIAFELLEISKITQEGNFILSEFENFHQYKALSFSLSHSICTIVYPKQVQLQLDALYPSLHLQKILNANFKK